MHMIEWVFAEPVDSVPSAPILRANNPATLFALRDAPGARLLANISDIASLYSRAIAPHFPGRPFNMPMANQLTEALTHVALSQGLIDVSPNVGLACHHTATNEARNHPSTEYLNTRAFFTFSERGWNPTSRRMSRAAWM